MVKSAETSLAWRQIGDGSRQVLALHCSIAHSGAWRALASHFPDCSFIAPDMLSHGKSPDWDGEGEFPDLIMAGVRPFLRAPMDLIGHSFGGTVALRLAVEQPDLVRSLTLIEPVLFAVAAKDAPEVMAQHDQDARAVITAFEAQDWPLAARLFNRMWATKGTPRWPDLPETTRAGMIRGVHIVPGCDGAVYHDRPGLLVPGVLEALQVPTLLLRGDLTHPIIPAVNAGLARRLPNATDVCVPDAGHMLPLTHPGETAGHVRDLFSRTAD